MAIFLSGNPLKCIIDDCDGDFIIRKNIKDNIYFLGCSKFPKCNKTISIDSDEALKLDIYRKVFTTVEKWESETYSDLSPNQVLNHIRHTLIAREIPWLDRKHPSNIDFNQLNRILKINSLKELSDWINDEVDKRNIDTHWHRPLSSSPYSDYLVYEMLPYIENHQLLSEEFNSVFEDK